MTSLSDVVSKIRGFGQYGASSDDLIRQAQTGDLGAYKELMRRGEIIPPTGDTPGRFGQHGRPGGAAMPGLEQPAYLDRGISRDMARPAQAPDMGGEQPQGLPYMSAINPQQQEAPDYLGQGMMQQPEVSPGQQRIQNLANGNDAVASIQTGTSAADDVAGVSSPTADLPAPIKSLAEAFAGHDEEQDPYEEQSAKTIQDLLSSINPEQNKNMALAQAGFAMAGSGSPYFFQGVGIGGQAGLKSYNESQDRDMQARVRATQLGTDLSQNRERKRANRAGEFIQASQQDETARHNVAGEAVDTGRLQETARSNKASEGIARSQVGISAQNAATSAGQLKVAQDNFALVQREYSEGKAGKDELLAAQTDLVKAQKDAQDALNLDRTTDIQIGEDSTLYNVDKKTNKATPILGPDGNAIKAQPKNMSATAFKTQYLAGAGWSKDAIADAITGRKPVTAAQATAIATDRASKESATILDVTQQQSEFQRIYRETYDALTAPAADAGLRGDSTPKTNPYKSPDDVKRDYQAKKITKEQATDYIKQLQGQ